MEKLSMQELNRLTIDQFKNEEKIPIVIILDNIRSMNNVGSAFRTADAFKVNKIYLGGITASPPHKDITKTALGADESVNWEHEKDVIQIIETLRKDGYIICAIEQTKESTMLNNFAPNSNQKYAFIFGNEVFGVSDEVLNCVDICLEIPQFGTKHSLNVSVTMGIVCWDYVSKSLNFSKI